MRSSSTRKAAQRGLMAVRLTSPIRARVPLPTRASDLGRWMAARRLTLVEAPEIGTSRTLKQSRGNCALWLSPPALALMRVSGSSRQSSVHRRLRNQPVEEFAGSDGDCCGSCAPAVVWVPPLELGVPLDPPLP